MQASCQAPDYRRTEMAVTLKTGHKLIFFSGRNLGTTLPVYIPIHVPLKP